MREREADLLDAGALKSLLFPGRLADQQELDIFILLQERASEIQRVAAYATRPRGHLARIKGNAHPTSLTGAKVYVLLHPARA